MAKSSWFRWIGLVVVGVGFSAVFNPQTWCPVNDGQLTGYLNGRETARRNVRGTLENWAAYPLLFGDEWNSGRQWRGTIERVSLFNKAISRDSAAALFREH